MTIRTRKTSAGYAVSWRYRGHGYQTVVMSRERAKALRTAIRAKKHPSVVVAMGYGRAISAQEAGGATNDASAEYGRLGGLKRAQNLSGPERSRIASQASKARWAKKPAEVTNG